MKRRRKWKAPVISQAAARELWALCFHGEGWPRGWRVRWAGFMRGAGGLCVYGRREIMLSYGDYARRDGVLSTLVHEFIHVRNPGLKHGREFSALVDAACGRAGVPAVDTEHRAANIRARRWVYFNPSDGFAADVVRGLGAIFGWRS